MNIEQELKDKFEINENGILIRKRQDLFIQVPIEFIRNPKYTIAEKTLYMYIWTYGITSKVGFPSQPNIAKDLGAGLTFIRSTLRSLEEKNGFCRVQRIYKGTKEKSTCIYFLSGIDKNGEFEKEDLDIVKKVYPDRVKYIEKGEE